MNPRQTRIAVVGGGTGQSTMLRGLKAQSDDITAIVTVTDDGGGSGILRRELKIPPPGDIRNCIQALADTEASMGELLNYRFREGSYKGQSLGNLILAALADKYDSFDKAVTALSQVLAITGRVLPVTNEDLILEARFSDGAIIRGETAITSYKKCTDAVIEQVGLDPASPAPLPAVLDAIAAADMIVLGPGSLYTSIIPNLLVPGVAETVRESRAVKVYVMNVMTQDGETEGYTAAHHVRAMLRHGGEGLFRYVLINSLAVPEDQAEAYRKENAVPVITDGAELWAMGLEPVFAPVATWKDGLVRHDPDALASALMDIYYAKASTRTAY